MDPDVRSAKPDRCRKCGMKLVAGIPDPLEYPVDLEVQPRVPDPSRPVRLTFRILHPSTGKPAELDIIHEKLFHLFIISQDLKVFMHEHPELQADGSFVYETKLAGGHGLYRLLADFYPKGGTPQMIAKTVLFPGGAVQPELTPDTRAQAGENVRVSLRAEPDPPLAGKKTMLFFELDPPEGLEQYLGAWGHMLAASADLVDMLHAHPAWEESGPKIQFNVIFPRPGMHRVWVQFQRKGVVNTVAFNVPVTEL
jgi:hypothetical protein